MANNEIGGEKQIQLPGNIVQSPGSTHGSSGHGSSHGSSPPIELQVPSRASPTHSPNHSPRPLRSERSSVREISPDKPDSESQGSCGKGDCIAPPEFVRSLSQVSQESEKKERKESRSSDRTKKKSSWYHALTPNYKTRCEEFKKYFKELPPDERLIVDYSCAVQKDILVQGRLYCTHNYLCFYAIYFRWETCICIRWKDVTSVTKEKTALIIPNAIMISTESEKLFFTTFNQRDKAYLSLFRIWQNALMEKPLSTKDTWAMVHDAYGEELGLSSDDEYYEQKVGGSIEEKMLNPNIRLSGDSFSEQDSRSMAGSITEKISANASPCEPIVSPIEPMHKTSSLHGPDDKSPVGGDGPEQTLPTDLSDTTESDVDRNIIEPNSCTCTHEGRCLINVSLPIHVDQLFTLLFTNSKFFLEFHAIRRTTDIKASSWQLNPETSEKVRTISMVVALAQTLGPRSAQVTETQVMKSCSKPGQMYAIDGDVINAGIPYADSFYVNNHYCLSRRGEHETTFSIHAQLKYRKSVWGLVKSVIEKNTWAGLDDFYDGLLKALQTECGESGLKGRKNRRRPRGTATPVLLPTEDLPTQSRVASIKMSGIGEGEKRNDFLIGVVLAVLLFLLILNVLLYYKLWVLEAWAKSSRSSLTSLDLEVLSNPPKTHEEWLELFRQQENLHKAELARWQAVLQAAVKLLRKAEVALSGLQDRSNFPRDEL